jgi:hypothetical protein
MDDKQSCKKKTFKKDRKLHKMESRDRVKKIAKCAEESNDLSMMKIIESDGFIERAAIIMDGQRLSLFSYCLS